MTKRFGPGCAGPMGTAIDLVLAFIEAASPEQALEVLNRSDWRHTAGHLAALVNALGRMVSTAGDPPAVLFRNPGPAMRDAIGIALRFLGETGSISGASDEEVRDGVAVLAYIAATTAQMWTGQQRAPERLFRSLRDCCDDPVAMDRVIRQSGRCN